VRYFEQARQLLPIAAGFLNRWPIWSGGEASGTGASRTSTKPSGSTRATFTYSPSTRLPISSIVIYPKHCEVDQVLNITPDDVDTLAYKAAIAQAEGDLPRAAALLAPLHPNEDNLDALGTQVYQAILERRPAQIILG